MANARGDHSLKKNAEVLPMISIATAPGKKKIIKAYKVMRKAPL